jgi:Tfp pilus assembly protein PilN
MIERIEINLLPAEYRIRKRNLNLPRSIVYPVVILLTLAVGAGLYTIYLNDKEAKLKEEIEIVTKKIQENKHIQTEINQLRQQISVTDQKIRALERISVDREKWVRLMEVLSGNLPTYSWLVSVKEEMGATPQKLSIEARTHSFPEVAHYMTRLEGSEYMGGVTLMSIEQIQGQDRKIYRFTLVCTLAEDSAPAPVEEEAKPAETNTGRRGRAARGGR